MLSLYVDNGLFEEAFWLFEKLRFEDVLLDFFVFPVILKMCSGLGIGEIGRQLHGILIKYQFVSNIYVGNALIDTYGECRSLDDVKKVLETMPEKNRVMECCSYRFCSQWEGV